MPSSLLTPTNETTLDGWFMDHLVCPRDHRRLALSNGRLACAAGHSYPVVKGIPVMLLDDVPETLNVMSVSAEQARCGRAGDDTNEFFLETLGISAEERQGVAQLAAKGNATVDPVVSFLVAATNGIMYRPLIGKLESYPVPELPLPEREWEDVFGHWLQLGTVVHCGGEKRLCAGRARPVTRRRASGAAGCHSTGCERSICRRRCPVAAFQGAFF